ncbi:MAG: hypothetical protein Q4D57_03510, partial [Clostridia bacterium]|nr:hypothetical protein [Clostridia bacterium]
MTVEAIASYATNYAKAFGGSSKDVTKKFDSRITYSEFCQILDISARSRFKKLKQDEKDGSAGNKPQEDKRPFDERFRSVIESNKDDLEKTELKLIYDWMSGKPKKISQIYKIMTIFTSEIDTVPECFFNEEEIFGHITFIKYLTDKGIISLD